MTIMILMAWDENDIDISVEKIKKITPWKEVIQNSEHFRLFQTPKM